MDLSIGGTMRTLRRFPILYGVTWGLVTAILGTLAVSLWAHFHPLEDRTIITYAYFIHCTAALVGAFTASRTARVRGWYYGGLTGLVYAIVLACLEVLLFHSFAIGPGGLFRMLLLAVIGAFGGVIGVNTTHSD